MDERDLSAFARPGKPPPVQAQGEKRQGPTPDTPVVFGRLTARGVLVVVTCPHCRRLHRHGSAGIVDGRNRHRLPHCAEPAPAATRGYFVAVRP